MMYQGSRARDPGSPSQAEIGQAGYAQSPTPPIPPSTPVPMVGRGKLRQVKVWVEKDKVCLGMEWECVEVAQVVKV